MVQTTATEAQCSGTLDQYVCTFYERKLYIDTNSMFLDFQQLDAEESIVAGRSVIRLFGVTEVRFLNLIPGCLDTNLF